MRYRWISVSQIQLPECRCAFLQNAPEDGRFGTNIIERELLEGPVALRGKIGREQWAVVPARERSEMKRSYSLGKAQSPRTAVLGRVDESLNSREGGEHVQEGAIGEWGVTGPEV